MVTLGSLLVMVMVGKEPGPRQSSSSSDSPPTRVTFLFCELTGAQACVLVFSTTDRESFDAISSWREKVVAEVGDIPTVLVQNKIDLLDDSRIKNEEAEALAKRLKLRFYRTSVKEDLNVNEVFKYLAEKYLQKLKQQIAEDPELMHSSSNKIGVFNTSGGSHSGQNSSTLNGGDVINLRPNKQRTKKSRNPFSSCSIP
ncbi:PREDICTED: ras-related protein Rab-23 [Galeopterus variegatus]|uniref:small monomeric GTPase n=1 Tax=Galeopterus variegatus TaxID=482537 RepID=A0ABM0QPW8_GALVR|nr:PREDICTED: ras-related protein Rab-23 [Galeopterus variegatus]